MINVAIRRIYMDIWCIGILVLFVGSFLIQTFARGNVFLSMLFTNFRLSLKFLKKNGAVKIT